jgi:hypothetical protein
MIQPSTKRVVVPIDSTIDNEFEGQEVDTSGYSRVTFFYYMWQDRCFL